MVEVPDEFGEKWDLADEVPAGLATAFPLADLIAGARLMEPSEVARLAEGAKSLAEQRRLLGYKSGYSRVPLIATQTALSLLDPNMYGNEWRKVARCIYYAYADTGLDIFDIWSQGSTEKYRPGEPKRLWQDFDQEEGFRGKVLAWLFGRATAILTERQNDDDSRVPNVELDKKAIIRASIEELSENHAVVVRGSKTGVLWENYDPRFGRFTETYLSRRDFTDRYMRSVEIPPTEEEKEKAGKKGPTKKTSPQGSLWFNSSARRSYDGVIFAPGQDHGPELINLWRGFTVEPTGDFDGWSHLKQHLRDHVAGGDQASFDYLLNWLAFAVQRLDRRIGTALILLGKKGAGKSIITELFGQLFGQHTFVTSRMDDVIGRFNERLETTILLGLEEAVAPNSRSADGTLKDLLTRKLLRLEGKFVGIWEAPNHLRVIVTSNNEHVVRADSSERRYAVFDVTNPHQADPSARAAYFGKMVTQMETGGFSAMLGELLERNISHWNAEIIPETPALKRQKLLTLSTDPVRMYLHDRLTDGIFITGDNASGAFHIHRWSETETVMVPARDLRMDFRAFVEANGIQAGDRQLAMNLPTYMPEGFAAKTLRARNGDQLTGTYKAYPFPPLEIARQLFERATGLEISREPSE